MSRPRSPAPDPPGQDAAVPDPACALSFFGLALHLDQTGTVIRAWGTGLGWTGLDDPTGRRFDAVIPAEILQAADLPTRIGEALSTRLPVQVPRVEIGLEPAVRHLRVKVTPVPQRPLEVVVVLDDVTDAVEAVVRAERRACQSRTAVLAANVAHEMRNPLSALSLTLQVVGAPTSMPDARRRAVLEKVQALVVRLDGIVEDLVEYSRPPSVALRTVDLVGLVRDTLPATAPAAEVRVEGPAWALADPSLLGQALAGLLSNARGAASSSDQVEVSVGPGPRIAVSDDGPPVASVARDRLFDPFSRVRSRNESGLTLAMARKLVEAMGGTLNLEPSDTNRFTLRIHLSAPEGSSPSRSGSAARSG